MRMVLALAQEIGFRDSRFVDRVSPVLLLSRVGGRGRVATVSSAALMRLRHVMCGVAVGRIMCIEPPYCYTPSSYFYVAFL